MARLALLVLAALVLTVLPGRTWAGDVFTGFQIDNKRQYFGYVGVRTPILQMSGGTTLFAQAMTAGLGYSFRSGTRLLDANVQFVVPSVGISQSLGRWTFLALGGPQLRRIEEDRLNTSAKVDHQIGAFGQIEAFYWHEKGNLHAIGSYADLDNFFWSRLRGKLLIHKSEKGCCPLYAGWDIAGMGNGDFRAVQTGPVVEISVGKVAFLAKGGYQHSTSFHSGGYGGIEAYFPF
ncbi:MAG: cellulose biosynthesis protein BcsS [Nitrospira sp.]|nr:cellulose biosynthesis protein BcsS [Nitrospira sp.]